MRKLNILCNARMICIAFTGISLLFLCPSMAQNTSYNTNSIPIGGTNSAACGWDALSDNTGGKNTGIGFQALRFNTNGSFNAANGYRALYNNTTGHGNTANGTQALFTNTTGAVNTANGFNSLFSNTTGNNNTANGFYSLYSNEIGSNNVALGRAAGFNSMGSENIYIGYEAGYNEKGSNKFYLGNGSANTLIYGNMATRQILLGNANPTGYTFLGTRTLNVLGGVLADSIRVVLSGLWSDYVFDDNYPLKPLEEVNLFIKANRHLPGIPSAAEVKANGIELGDMNARLLAKIEELTLYMLQQQEQMNAQQKQIDELTNLVSNKQ